ncbi:hypothetical protein JCM16303_007422 [Sporobolomyces ruberrimus]
MSSLSSPPSFVSSLPLVLYAVSATLLITVSVLPLFLASRLVRSLRSDSVNNNKAAIGLILASTLSLALAGICSLTAIGNESIGSAIVGGVLGALSLLLIDAQALIRLIWVENPEAYLSRKSSCIAGLLSLLLFITTTLQVSLLALDDPSQEKLFGLAHARGIFHLAFDILIISLLVRRLIKAVDQERQRESRDVESEYVRENTANSMRSSRETKLEHRVPRSASAPTQLGGPSTILERCEPPLIALQLLSALLSILSVSLPMISNYLPIDSSRAYYVSPSLFGSTTTPAGTVAVSIVVVLRWNAHPTPLPTIDIETGCEPTKAIPVAGSESTPSFTPLVRTSAATSLDPASEGSSTLNTSEAPNSAVERPLASRSRSHSISSALSFSANVPPRISEECERSNQEESSCGSPEPSETYLHSETFPAPFLQPEDDLEGERGFSLGSQNRPRSASSPEPYHRPSSPRTPSPVTFRTRKDAGRLARPEFDRSDSATSSGSNNSPVLLRPSLSIDVSPEESYHSAVSRTPARSRKSDSGCSTPSPTKSRRPSLRSLVGISSPRISPSDSPTIGIHRLRRGSRSSSISFLRGRGVEDDPEIPSLEVETDEEDPFAAVQASQAIEATRKVEEWARRRTSEGDMLEAEGGFEEDIEIISPSRESFERLCAPSRVTTTALAHLSDPRLHPRRSPSLSNSLFHEHLYSPNNSPEFGRRQQLGGPIDLRSRSGSLESAFTLSSKTSMMQGDPTTPYRFGKSFAQRPSLSQASSSTKLLEAIGLRSDSSQPPRADSLTSRPLSSQVTKEEESPEQHRARTRSSAPPPSTGSTSPRVSPIRRFFARQPSATGGFFSTSPPVINHPSPIEMQIRKGSRASSTFSSASFRLARLRRSSTSNLLKPPANIAGGGGGAVAASHISTKSFRRSASSDLSFMCRGDGGSSFESAAGQSLARSVSLDFQIGASSQPSSSSGKNSSKDYSRSDMVGHDASSTSPTRTTNWWTQGDFAPRSLTPYRPSRPARRDKHSRRPRSSSAPAPSSSGKNQASDVDSEAETSERKLGRQRGRHVRSQSVPLNQLSDYQLKIPTRISPIGSLRLSIDNDPITNVEDSALALEPPINLAQPLGKSSSARSARSSLSISTANLKEDFALHSRDRTISEGDLEELTALYETFTPVEATASVSHSPVTSSAPFSPTSWHDTDVSSSPSSTPQSSSSSLPPSPALSHSSLDIGLSRMSTDSCPAGSTIDYWSRERSKWLEQDEEECLEATGESEQLF